MRLPTLLAIICTLPTFTPAAQASANTGSQ